MDGYPVSVGDSVYDLLLGGGHVSYVDESQIQVSFGGGRTLTYSPSGHFGTVKRLYWTDPILEIPHKNDPVRPLLKELIQVVRKRVDTQLL